MYIQLLFLFFFPIDSKFICVDRLDIENIDKLSLGILREHLIIKRKEKVRQFISHIPGHYNNANGTGDKWTFLTLIDLAFCYSEHSLLRDCSQQDPLTRLSTLRTSLVPSSAKTRESTSTYLRVECTWANGWKCRTKLITVWCNFPKQYTMRRWHTWPFSTALVFLASAQVSTRSFFFHGQNWL